MTDERERIVDLLAQGRGARLTTALLCQVCADVTGLDGAAIVLFSDDVSQSRAGASDSVADVIEEAQFTFGEGPCVDAYAQDRPVLEEDLRDTVRWPSYTRATLDAGARAVFAFPLRAIGHAFGALSFYRHSAGPLTEEQHNDALAMAEVASEGVLQMQSNAPPGSLAIELMTGGDARAAVHQAAGMISVQTNTSVVNALIRLRALAYSSDRSSVEVAKEVVSRRLRFDLSDA